MAADAVMRMRSPRSSRFSLRDRRQEALEQAGVSCRHVPTREVVTMTTMTAREFNQDVSAAKRAAVEGPVVITDRGEPAYVLLTIDEYRQLHGDGKDLVARLSMDEEYDDVGFEPAPLQVGLKVPEL